MHHLEHDPHLWNNEGSGDEYPCECHAPTQLEPLETSGFGPRNLSQVFRHSGWQRQREQVYEALRDSCASPGRRDSFAYCGATCHVLRSKTDPTTIKLAASCCHDRFCKPCASTRARTISGNVAKHMQNKQCRFITLTLKHSGNTLKEEIERLYDAFKRLRKTSLWKTTQKGGVAFLEIKRSRDRQSWHPHFHVLTQGKFIDGIRLSHTWKAITLDSYIVDVKLVRDQKSALDYVTKYASKPFDNTLFEKHETLVEAIDALHGKRMAITFGNWKGLQMTEKPDKDAWEFLDTLEGLCSRAAAGDPKAEAIVIAACGERGKQLIDHVASRTRARINLPPPPTPEVETYLIDVADHRRSCYP